MAEPVGLQASVYGRVQGVFFRAFVMDKAKELGLRGYVRNAPDGSVELRAEGRREQLERLVAHLKVGPPAARVDRVQLDWREYSGGYSGFGVRA